MFLILPLRQAGREVAIREAEKKGEKKNSFDFALKDIFYKCKQSNEFFSHIRNHFGPDNCLKMLNGMSSCINN